MEDFLRVVVISTIMFFICSLFFVPTIDRITALEKLHNEYVCLDCGSLVKK